MVEEGVIKYLPWRECISREDEVLGVKKSKEWRPDANHVVREVVGVNPDNLNADTSSDMKLYIALGRRGAAMEMGGLMRHEHHQELVRIFLRALLKKPYEGYAPISHEQLQRADQEIWRIVSDNTRRGLAVNNGQFPAAVALEGALKDNG
eukprot:6477591-Amphidinium_carterae.1